MTNKVLPDSVEPEYLQGSNTLKNLLNISDTKLLASKEADITFIRSLEIFSNPEIIEPYSFDFSHLRAIHKHLFGDIFAWAGKPRSYNMAKSGDAFTPATELAKYESIVFQPSIELFKNNKPLTKQFIVKQLSRSLGLINKFHPFPEGNGRAQRLFIFSLAKERNYSIDWASVLNWEMVEVCKRAHEGDYQPMENLISRILQN